MPETEAFISRVREIAGPEALDNEPTSLRRYSLSGASPAAVVKPEDECMMSEIMETASQHNGKLVIAGSGTKLNCGFPPKGEYLTLSTRKLDRVSDHDVPNFTVTAQTGALLTSLNGVLAREKQYLPLDPPYEEATLGGTLCSNSNGPLRLLYGGLRDLILGARIITPQGVRGSFGGKVVKNVAGYDISRFLMGSVGTLCLLEEATMKLFPLPEREATCTALFKAPGPALAAADQLRTSQLSPARIVLLEEETVTLAGTDDVIPRRKGCCTLLISFHGFEDSVRRQLKDTHRAFEAHGAVDIESLENDRKLWEIIRAINQRASDENAAILKIGLPSSKLGETFHQGLLKPNNSGKSCTMVDAGCGIIYLYLFHNENDASPALSETIEGIAAGITMYGGHLTIENSHSPLEIDREADAERLSAHKAMELIRQKFDPKRILCPERFPRLFKA